MSKCHIVGNHMSWLISGLFNGLLHYLLHVIHCQGLMFLAKFDTFKKYTRFCNLILQVRLFANFLNSIKTCCHKIKSLKR